MNIKLYLDTRATKQGKPAPLKICISHNGRSALLLTGVTLLKEQFNADKGRVEKHPNKVFLNSFLKRRLYDVEEIILNLSTERKLASMTATELKNFIDAKLKGIDVTKKIPTINDVFEEYIGKINKYATKNTYLLTRSELLRFDKDFKKKHFEDISIDYLEKFVGFMSEHNLKPNSQILIMSKFRTIFNYAVSHEITSNYPFNKLKLKSEKTRKRALSLAQLREIFSHELPKHLSVYRDIFKLSFCLIGINIVDLAQLKSMENGRIEYRRSKTGKLYSIKIEPETLELINRLQDENFLVGEIAKHKRYYSFCHKYNIALREIANITFKGTESEYLANDITHYWIRHTWATIAASIDIPRDVISHALGHGNDTVTDVYIDFDIRKVDVANRKVLDYVFGK